MHCHRVCGIYQPRVPARTNMTIVSIPTTFVSIAATTLEPPPRTPTTTPVPGVFPEQTSAIVLSSKTRQLSLQPPAVSGTSRGLLGTVSTTSPGAPTASATQAARESRPPVRAAVSSKATPTLMSQPPRSTQTTSDANPSGRPISSKEPSKAQEPSINPAEASDAASKLGSAPERPPPASSPNGKSTANPTPSGEIAPATPTRVAASVRSQDPAAVASNPKAPDAVPTGQRTKSQDLGFIGTVPSRSVLDNDVSTTTTSTSPTNRVVTAVEPPARQNTKLPAGAIAGITVGGAILLALIGLLAWRWRRRAMRKRGERLDSPAGDVTPSLRGGPGTSLIPASLAGNRQGQMQSLNALEKPKGLGFGARPRLPLIPKLLHIPNLSKRAQTQQVSNLARAPERPERAPQMPTIDTSGMTTNASNGRSVFAVPTYAIDSEQGFDTKGLTAELQTVMDGNDTSAGAAPPIPPRERARKSRAPGFDPSAPPQQSTQRDSLQSVDSATGRRTKFRSDPFDLEIDDRHFKSTPPGAPAMPSRYTAASASSSKYTSTASISASDWSIYRSSGQTGSATRPSLGSGTSIRGDSVTLVAPLNLGKGQAQNTPDEGTNNVIFGQAL